MMSQTINKNLIRLFAALFFVFGSMFFASQAGAQINPTFVEVMPKGWSDVCNDSRSAFVFERENRSFYISRAWIGGTTEYDDQIYWRIGRGASEYASDADGYYGYTGPCGGGGAGSGWVGPVDINPHGGDTDVFTFGITAIQKRTVDNNYFHGKIHYAVTKEACATGQFTLNNSCQNVAGTISAAPTSCQAPCNPVVSWNATGVDAKIEKRVNGVLVSDNWKSGVSGGETDASLPEGTYNYKLLVQDGFGNYFEPTNGNVTVTVTNPSVPTLTCSPANSYVSPGSSVTFNAGGGSGSYTWSSTGSNGSSNGSSYSATFNSSGSATVIDSSGSSAICSVTVSTAQCPVANNLAVSVNPSSINVGEVATWTVDSAVRGMPFALEITNMSAVNPTPATYSGSTLYTTTANYSQATTYRGVVKYQGVECGSATLTVNGSGTTTPPPTSPTLRISVAPRGSTNFTADPLSINTGQQVDVRAYWSNGFSLAGYPGTYTLVCGNGGGGTVNVGGTYSSPIFGTCTYNNPSTSGFPFRIYVTKTCSTGVSCISATSNNVPVTVSVPNFNAQSSVSCNASSVRHDLSWTAYPGASYYTVTTPGSSAVNVGNATSYSHTKNSPAYLNDQIRAYNSAGSSIAASNPTNLPTNYGNYYCVGDISVRATLDGAAWSGPVKYSLNGPSTAESGTSDVNLPTSLNPTLTSPASYYCLEGGELYYEDGNPYCWYGEEYGSGPAEVEPAVYNYNNVKYPDLSAGSWTISYVSGGPVGKYLTSVTDSAGQTLLTQSGRGQSLNPQSGTQTITGPSLNTKPSATYFLNFTTQPPTITLAVSINAGLGTITGLGINCPGDCNESYTSGQQVTLTVTPSSGYVFGGWTDDCAGQGSSCTLIMNSSKSAGVTFNAAPSLLNVTCSRSPATVLLGQNVTWTANVSGGTPPYSYAWSGSDISTSPAPSSNPYVKSYSTIGLKTASVTVTDFASAQASCSPAATVQVNFNPDYTEF